MKVIAIDYGLKRVGLAVGDTELGLAVPKAVLKNDARLIDRIREVVEETGAEKVVVGLPLTPSGREGERARLVKEFVERLREDLRHVDIELWDERYTTLAAQDRLRHLNPKKRKQLLDSVSAQLILEEYLKSL
ncbi:Holliday junction resolvase RuvX [Hydrogenivirga sp.]